MLVALLDVFPAAYLLGLSSGSLERVPVLLSLSDQLSSPFGFLMLKQRLMASEDHDLLTSRQAEEEGCHRCTGPWCRIPCGSHRRREVLLAFLQELFALF